MTTPTERSFPFDGVAGADAGPYSSEYFAQIQQAFLGAYTRRTTSGVLLGVGDGSNESLLVTETSPRSLGVKVFTGWAMVNGRMYQLTTDTTVAVTQNTDASGDDRIDSIVLRLDVTNGETRLVDKQGTVAPAPVAPSLTQSATIWEIRIANVTVQNLATEIFNADIDTTVRAYAVKRSVKEGGTGLATIAIGQLLAGSAADVMTAVGAAPNYGGLVGNTSEATYMKWVGKRPTKIRANSSGGTAINTSRTLLPFASADSVNPDSYITALVANQFSLAAGSYKVWGFVAIQASENIEAARVAWWIADSTAPATGLATSLMGSTVGDAGGTLPTAILIPMTPTLLESAGTELFEVYAQRVGGVANSALMASAAAFDPGTPYTREIFFEKIR